MAIKTGGISRDTDSGFIRDGFGGGIDVVGGFIVAGDAYGSGVKL